MSVQQEDQLLDIANDDNLTFVTTTLQMFWIKIKSEYPDLAIISLKTLLSFSTSNLYKSGFSVMTATKTKPQNRLDVRDTLWVSLTNI